MKMPLVGKNFLKIRRRKKLGNNKHGLFIDPSEIIYLVPVIAVLYNIHLRNFIRYICSYMGLLGLEDVINAVFFDTLFIMAVLLLLRDVSGKALGIVCILLLFVFFAVEYTLIRNDIVLSEQIFPFLLFEYIPAGIVVAFIKDYDRLLRSFSFHGKILLIYMVVELRKYLMDPLALKYNMTYGYTCMFLALIFICAVRRNFPYKILNAVCGAFCCITSIMYGSRAVVMIFLVYIAYLIFRSKRIKSEIKIILALLGMFFLLFRVQIADALYYGTLALTGLDIIPLKRIGFSLGERNLLWITDLEYIFGDMPVLGGGLYIDRVVLSEQGFGYAHNLFLELIMDFGVIGIVFSVIVGTGIICELLRGSKSDEFKVAVIVYSFVYLFFSSSYLENQYFWIMLGMLSGNVGGMLRNPSKTPVGVLKREYK